ncbi:MAG: hypothetical protein K6G00_05245 [Treponema sp.]|nr:hypothetical protein [Treponema sp.]
MKKLCRPKFIMALLIMMGFVVNAATAAAISFQIIQHDSSQDKIRSASVVVENTFFDYFFDQGNIVTNFPTAVSFSTSEDQSIYYKSLDDSKEGLCHYFIALIMEYDTSDSYNPEAVVLQNIKEIKWSLFDAKTGNKLSDGNKKVGKIKDSSNNRNGVAVLSRAVATEINKFLIER